MESAFENLYTEELYALPSRTLIILDREWSQLSVEEKTLLQKILASVKLSLPAVQIITRDMVEHASLAALNPERVISFGVPGSPPMPQYQHNSLNGLSVIYSDSLRDLDDTRKKNLWLALKQMFGM